MTACAAAAAFFTVATLNHLDFSLWLLDEHQTPFGAIRPVDHLNTLFVLGALLAAGWMAYTASRGVRRRETLAFCGLWLGAAVLVDRVLIFGVPEYFHYPQYAMLAWLIARAADPDRSRFVVATVLFWSTLLGAIDELCQYLYLTVDYSRYFDFNDVVINLLGAAAGVLLYYGFRPVPDARAGGSWQTRAAAVAFATIAAIAVSNGRVAVEPQREVPPGGIGTDASGRAVLYLQREPGLYGSRQPARNEGTYYVAGPVEGGLAILVAGGLFSAFGASRRRGARFAPSAAARPVRPRAPRKPEGNVTVAPGPAPRRVPSESPGY